MKIKKIKGSLLQFIKFAIVGVSNTFIGLGTYYLFLFLEFHYLVSNVFSWMISVFNAFFWNNRYALLRTYISYGFSFLIGSFLLFIMVEWLHISDRIAPLLILLITVPLNFLLNKFWTFK